MKVIIGAVVVGVLVVIAVVLGVVFGMGGGGGPQDCSGDGFEAVTYRRADGSTAYLKISVIAKYMKYEEAKRNCTAIDGDSRMWEVSNAGHDLAGHLV